MCDRAASDGAQLACEHLGPCRRRLGGAAAGDVRWDETREGQSPQAALLVSRGAIDDPRSTRQKNIAASRHSKSSREFPMTGHYAQQTAPLGVGRYLQMAVREA